MGKKRVIEIEGYAPEIPHTLLGIPASASDFVTKQLSLAATTEGRALQATFISKRFREGSGDELDTEDPQAVLRALYFSAAGVVGSLAVYTIKESEMSVDVAEIIAAEDGFMDANVAEIIAAESAFLEAKVHFQLTMAHLVRVFGQERPSAIVAFLSENIDKAWEAVGDHRSLSGERRDGMRNGRLNGMLREFNIHRSLENSGFETRYGNYHQERNEQIDVVTTVPLVERGETIEVPIQVKPPLDGSDIPLEIDIAINPMHVYVAIDRYGNPLKLPPEQGDDLAQAVQRKAAALLAS